MAKSKSVYNLTKGYWLKRNQALKAIENCACAWVEYDQTIRNLTLAESIAARNEQAQKRQELAWVELPGLTFKQPANANCSAHQRAQLIFEANRFCAMGA